MVKTNIAIVTQARFGSSRLKGKILKEVEGKSLLEIHLNRLKKSLHSNTLVVATTLEPESSHIINIAKKIGCSYYQGSTDDVLDRFYNAVKPFNPTIVVRITSDCPLVDPTLIDNMIHRLIEQQIDYCSNTINPTYPDGFDCEVFTFDALKKAWVEAKLRSEREHVTPYIWKNSTYHNNNLFKSSSYENNIDHSHLRLTVDNQADFDLIKIIIETLGDNKTWEEYTAFLLKHPDLININKHLTRNEGYEKSIKADN